ncbi:hypothetical protein GYMLUDRAFT_250455 [Collybiopsis luxurians FD-317 M1]|uniref:Uncharacterized protein n=1 Tax=Collybiopsis luxurians FD-317 M1 TaxID=944289 RepID=A0A0D0BF94_9AGAR|nr:hypothetical protein GYMLUDRAFT_250455 [Collybiopsis luxurians FD-317 M1]
MTNIMSVDTSGPVPASNIQTLGIHPSAPSSSSAIQREARCHHPGPISQCLPPQWISLPHTLSSGTEGQMRLPRPSFSPYHLHHRLDKLGFITYCHPSFPIVPLLSSTRENDHVPPDDEGPQDAAHFVQGAVLPERESYEGGY